MTGIFSHSHAAENLQNDAAPDLEFLEFLGQFETDSGEWIDPDSLIHGIAVRFHRFHSRFYPLSVEWVRSLVSYFFII